MAELRTTSGEVVLIDDSDAHLAAYRWYYVGSSARNRYVVRGERIGAGTRQIPLHREIMAAGPGDVVDHINGNTLDNRRANLRFCTTKQNSQNRCTKFTARSRFKGIWCGNAGKPRPWRAMIEVEGRKIGLGSHETEVAAARAYDAAAVKYFGEFARTNEQMGLYEAA